MQYLRRPNSLPFLPVFRVMFSTTSSSPGSVESSIRDKLTSLLRPQTLIIQNDSWQHRHHEAMRENQGNAETHFTVNVVSEEFKGKTTMQRHQMIYSTLADQFSSGLHALSLNTKTPEEAEAVVLKDNSASETR